MRARDAAAPVAHRSRVRSADRPGARTRTRVIRPPRPRRCGRGRGHRQGSRRSATACSRSPRRCSSWSSASEPRPGRDSGTRCSSSGRRISPTSTSFLTIGIIWINHHYCVQTLARSDRTLLFLNLLLLLIVGFLPFPTKLVAQYLQQPGERDAAVYAYAATFVVMSIVYNTWWRYASTGRRLIRDSSPTPPCVRSAARSIPACRCTRPCSSSRSFSPLASVALTFAIAAFYLPSAALFAER